MSLSAQSDPLHAVRVIVCDDDDGARSVVSGLVEDHGGQVIAETDRSVDAIDLISRFEPEVVILDLALAQGRGTEVIEFLDGRSLPTRVIVFTAFDGDVGADQAFVTIVRKPDFAGLEVALLQADEPAPDGERRRPVRSVPPTARRLDDGTDHPDEFYRLLAAAQPTDTLLCITLDGLDHDIAPDLRRVCRSQDRLLRRGTCLIALLIGGAGIAPTAVRGRLAAFVPDIDERAADIPVGDDPIEAFDDLTRILSERS